MKDIFCVVLFAGKLLGLAVFVNVLRPDNIVAVQASMEPIYCKTEHSRMRGCDVGTLAMTSGANVHCSDRPRVAHC